MALLNSKSGTSPPASSWKLLGFESRPFAWRWGDLIKVIISVILATVSEWMKARIEDRGELKTTNYQPTNYQLISGSAGHFVYNRGQDRRKGAIAPPDWDWAMMMEKSHLSLRSIAIAPSRLLAPEPVPIARNFDSK